jgi:transposase
LALARSCRAGKLAGPYLQADTMTAELPDDIAQLKQMLTQLQQQHQLLQSQSQAQAEEIGDLKAQLERALAQLKLNRAKRFGRQSEKAPRGTFNEAEQQSRLTPATKSRQKTGRKPLPVGLEREERVYTLDEPHCRCCGETMQSCGSEDSEQLKIVPARISVIKHRRTKYACRQCEQTATRTQLITAPKPAQPIPRSIASPEALAAVVTAKYCDALPLYRQCDILARIGLEISRSTLANWCIKAGELLQPLLEQMRRELLSQAVLCADETRVQVLSEPERAAETQSYMWVYRSGEFHPQPVVLYDYQPGRGQAYPQAFLAGYRGYLLCDGYAAYGTLKAVTLSGCWAHARRKFSDALKAQPKKTGKATVALGYIQKLYAIERAAKGLPPDTRREIRQQQAGPLLDAFKDWLTESADMLLPKSYIGEAVNYTLKQWDKLSRYLEDGELSIDNNVTERDIRPFTTGRKNWLFSQSVGGAQASAALYSIVMTCRANDINPYFYFQRLFTELPQRPSGADLSDLLPWNVELDAE